MGAPANALFSALRPFCDALEAQLAWEERGGYLRDVVAQRPELDRRVERLHAQHAAMREEMGSLRARPVSARDMREHVSALLALIRRHEHREREVLQDSLMQDLGVGD